MARRKAQNAPDALTNNYVHWQPSGTGPYRKTVGLGVAGRTSVSGSRLSNLSQGMLTAGLDNSDVFDNLFRDCADGFVVQQNTANVVSRLGCNSFLRDQSTYYTRGIVVEQGATINDIGSDTSPAANKFDGMDEGIRNNNTSTLNYTLRYFRTTSPQEVPVLGGPGQTQIPYSTTQPPILTNYCYSQQGATNGNGINSRGTPPSPEYLAAIMDSVRRQLVPLTRSRSYLHQIATYYRDAQQLPALEAWWPTLLGSNAPAYRTLGRFLLLNYDAQPATATDAHRVLMGLQPQAALDAELAAHLQLRAVVRHLPQTVPALTAADSTVLRAIAWGGTSSALSAGRWLRYFHPWLLLPPTTTTPGLRPVASRSLAVSGAALGAAYPNPAQTEVRIACRLTRAGQAAELRFTNLLTGQLALVVPMEGTGTERSQRVALHTLPAGQYAYQLVVDGQLAAAPQKLVVNP